MSDFAGFILPLVLLLLLLLLQVIELEGVFQLLRGDVERLFLQAPCVDLDALGQQLDEAEGTGNRGEVVLQVSCYRCSQ